MTIHLRAHHLLCLLTYVGKGYSPAFIANYDAIAARIDAGEPVLIVAGPDDICAPLLSNADPHCHRESVTDRDRDAAQAITSLLSQPVSPGAHLTLDAKTISRLRTAFSDGGIRKACVGCEWSKLCGEIAADAFRSVRIDQGSET